MKSTLYLQTSATHDLQEAFNWYEEQKPGLGSEFLSAADEVMARIEKNPLMFVQVFRHSAGQSYAGFLTMSFMK